MFGDSDAQNILDRPLESGQDRLEEEWRRCSASQPRWPLSPWPSRSICEWVAECRSSFALGAGETTAFLPYGMVAGSGCRWLGRRSQSTSRCKSRARGQRREGGG